MTLLTDAQARPHKALLTWIGVAATLTVFAVDIQLPHGYNITALYAVTVLVAGFSLRSRVVIRTTIGAWALVFVALAIKVVLHRHEVTATDVFGRIVASVVIVLIAVVVIVVIRSELKNVELGRALRLAEGDRAADQRMLAAASAVATIGTWSIDADDDRFDWSEQAAAMHGFPAGYRPTRAAVLAMIDPDGASRLAADLDLAWESGTPFRDELRITLPDGSHRWIVKMGETVRSETDGASRLHGTVQDITRWKEDELTASAQGKRFTQLTQSLPIMVWTAAPDGQIDYFNDAVLAYTGATRDELPLDKWMDALHPDDVDLSFRLWQQSVATGEPYDVETRMRDLEGVYRWHHVSAKPEVDESGAVVRWWGSTISIDANRRLREEADAIAAEREMILESMSEGVYALDPDWRMAYVNASAERILGFTREDLLGKVLWEALPRLEGGELQAFLQRAHERGKAARLTYHATRIDKWLELSVSPSPKGLTVFFHDATELRQLSDQLAQSQRLEAVGQLTGGIAHDFNNLLTVVLGGADALTADEALGDESREMVDLIGRAAERGAELTHRLLAFARRQPLEPKSVDLAVTLQQLEPLLRRTLGEDVRIVVAAPDSAPAEVDPGQFENALLNLAINSRDAMPGGGNLTIEVATVTLDEVYVTSHSDVAPGTYVVVTVTDSGIGIAPQAMAHLFDPFFTTKDMGKGSGLGLAMVWGFIKQSGGHVTVYSEPGLGTSFKMYLPPATTRPEPLAPASRPVSSRPTTGTILLAEDDDLVRAFATERLRAAGYDVVAAASGPEALTALAAMERIDLLFTDVIMPGGMTGRQLADAVTELRPGTPVLYASGYTENVILHNDRLDPGVILLAKPYSTRQLIERVGDLIPGSDRTPG